LLEDPVLEIDVKISQVSLLIAVLYFVSTPLFNESRNIPNIRLGKGINQSMNCDNACLRIGLSGQNGCQVESVRERKQVGLVSVGKQHLVIHFLGVNHSVHELL